MSHNIEYVTYSENVDRDMVKHELDRHVALEDYQEGCVGLYHPIRWLEDTICRNEEEAYKYLEQHDRLYYDNLAVRYYEPVGKPNTKQYQMLHDRTVREYNRYIKLNGVVYPQTVTAEFIGCKFCGSRLARVKLNGNRCPVCRGDLRPKGTLKEIAQAEMKWKKAADAETEYKDRHLEKRVRWLVKYEYHT